MTALGGLIGVFGMIIMVFLVLIIGLALWFIGAYNGLIRFRNEVKNAWAQIDVQLKRRHDLIPNLVETVKGYAGHEKSTFEEVVQARSQAVNANSVPEQAQAESMLSGALGRMMLLVENYPDLKANQNFLALQEELTSTENKLGFARQFYNDSVMKYNTQIQSIPTNIVAGMFNFGEEPFFELDDQAEREAPQVKF
ncbi:MAG: LemA family protein [Candidatus Hinthialibacter antarcticus]|nr:LemA family protein [Candidatus Hinthialibacter antarcticus]